MTSKAARRAERCGACGKLGVGCFPNADEQRIITFIHSLHQARARKRSRRHVGALIPSTYSNPQPLLTTISRRSTSSATPCAPVRRSTSGLAQPSLSPNRTLTGTMDGPKQKQYGVTRPILVSEPGPEERACNDRLVATLTRKNVFETLDGNKKRYRTRRSTCSRVQS